MTWIKVDGSASDKPVLVNMANAIYIRHNHADNTRAVIGFRDHKHHETNVRYDTLCLLESGSAPYRTDDHELRVNQSVDEVLSMIDKPLTLIYRMTE